MLYRKRLTRDQALQKLRQFCGYQERCHQEVRDKLCSLGVKPADREEIIAQLISDNYLNEERFAIAFAGGRFRIKSWGKIKIRHELRLREVSDYCIRKALGEIDDGQYKEVLFRLAREKFNSFEEAAPLQKKKKLSGYLTMRGFEAAAVREAVEYVSVEQN
jgi:regulatory protein